MTDNIIFNIEVQPNSNFNGIDNLKFNMTQQNKDELKPEQDLVKDEIKFIGRINGKLISQSHQGF